MSQPLSRSMAAAVVAGALVAATVLAQDARPKGKDAAAAQRTAGVITKVEEVGKQEGRRLRLTIKTDVVWRDYVRDTASQPPGEPLKKAAERGKDSVATKGQPKSPDDVIQVVVGPEATIESRFRAANEDTDAGSATAGQAVAKAEGKAADRRAAKPATLSPGDLKSGLYVEVEYRRARDRNRVARLSVIRPVDAAPAPPSAKEEGKSGK
jgi:hypothetical protein